MNDYVLSARAVRNGEFVLDVGPSKFLSVPPGELPTPSPGQQISRASWYKEVRTAAEWTNDEGQLRGDVLFIVHGYNNSIEDVMARHRLVRDDLIALGFKGVVVSFDWPSGDQALAYLDDRHRAKKAAMQLVSDGIVYLSKAQTPGCTTNVHVLGHSTGAYVIREAFDDADDTQLQNGGWTASQVIFAAGDVSSSSMGQQDHGAAHIYGHCIRFTNYYNRRDQILDISNVKRLGVAPRVGRIGLPPDTPLLAVNIDCTDYYGILETDESESPPDSPNGFRGSKCHSWYFGNKIFAQDLFKTLIGTDRTVIPTRGKAADGHLVLQRPIR